MGADPLLTLWAAVATAHRTPIRWQKDDGSWRLELVSGPNRRRFLELCELPGAQIGVPAKSGALTAGVLWAIVESGKSATLLRAFRPTPTLWLRKGPTVQHVALWALRQPVAAAEAESANRKIAHALRTAKKHSASVYVPAPGSAQGRHEVKVVGLNPQGLYDVDQVVGRLPLPPSGGGWRAAADA